MPATTPRRTPDELPRLGVQLFEQRIRPKLQAADDGKFVAIDVESGEYETDNDDYAAVARLRSRVPAADVWLTRAGFPAAYRMGLGR